MRTPTWQRRFCRPLAWGWNVAELHTWPADPRLNDDPTDFGPDGYQYGFIADDSDVVIAYAFLGIPFRDAESARHTAAKCYWETYIIVRRKPGEDWEEVDRA